MENDKADGVQGCGFAEGEFKPVSELSIPVTDMGFQLADMCYEVVHVRNGRFFRLDDHLDRWELSIAERRYDSLDYDRNCVEEILHGCVAQANLKDSMIYFLATRGSPSATHKDLRTCRNRFMAWAIPYYGAVSEEELSTGCDIVVAQTIRIPSEAVDPTVKNFGRLDFVRALFEAYDRNALYAVLLDQDDNVTEGRGWNIFMLREGRLISPKRGVLEGITRRTVIELAECLNVEAELASIPVTDLTHADEVLLSSTAGGIMPVRSIDGVNIGDGSPGPVTRRLTEMYWGLHDDPDYSTPVRYEPAGTIKDHGLMTA